MPHVTVMLNADAALSGEYSLIAYRQGKEIERHSLTFQPNPYSRQLTTEPDSSALFANVRLRAIPESIAVLARCDREAGLTEVLRQAVVWPAFEAEAAVVPENPANPVDLGAVLVPQDWLLLRSGGIAVVRAAAISQARAFPKARLRAWFDGAAPLEVSSPLEAGRRAALELKLPLTTSAARTRLHITITDGVRELWRKTIWTMAVSRVPGIPAFGAIETKLRYDAPIAVAAGAHGTTSVIDYENGWRPERTDIVVFLPNGSRFVFWRGASYAPFWASRNNTGFSYQWAETIPPPGYDGLIEALQDKELRYSRVAIVESSPSRVHVRWTYQPVDQAYRSLGDQVTEDYYFYPDGFGTRVATIASRRPQDYMWSEFIILLPQNALPLEVLPQPKIGLLFMSGERRRVTFPMAPGSFGRMDIPFPEETQGATYHRVERIFAQVLRYQTQDVRSGPRLDAGLMASSLQKVAYPSDQVVYRVADHKDDPATPIYFTPHASASLLLFRPFAENGEVVSAAYWGDHWPLRRGDSRGTLSERIVSGPGHLALADLEEPEPFTSGARNLVDALGKKGQVSVESRAWLIAKTDARDGDLLQWAHSFSSPPSLEMSGARTDLPSYAQERRAIRLVVESATVELTLKPTKYLVNPVFELADAPGALLEVTLDSRLLSKHEYAWDGTTLWIRALITASGGRLLLRFQEEPASRH